MQRTSSRCRRWGDAGSTPSSSRSSTTRDRAPSRGCRASATRCGQFCWRSSTRTGPDKRRTTGDRGNEAPSVPDPLPGWRRTRWRLYGFAFVDEFGPLFALYTLWFSDNGITAAQTSVVFALWASVGILLEIPSGALADRVDRCTVMAAALCLRAIGISVWLLWPSFAGILLGAGLWALHSAIASGTWEALVYDQVAAHHHRDAYPRVLARVEQFSHAGVALGLLLATFLATGGVSIETMGWLTAAVHLPAIGLLRSLKGARSADGEEEEELDSWWATLRSGLRTARRVPGVARMLAIGAVLEGMFIVDEYMPLLARQRGASDEWVPLFVLPVYLGVIAGGEVAARTAAMRARLVAWLLLAGATLLFVAVARSELGLLTLVGIGYAAIQTTWVLTSARTQAALPDSTRATVTSVRAFFAGIWATLAFAVVGMLSPAQDPSLGLLVAVPAYLPVVIMIWAWLPEHRRSGPPRESG
ncbi:MAG: MFS transporter [Myxococcales bacterium FL481]|nr:MAG: MFS transporter [Myxococcales bacterium FL481]